MGDEENHYVRCPNCPFEKTEITGRSARSHQKNGCPNCDDNRGLAVSTMDAL